MQEPNITNSAAPEAEKKSKKLLWLIILTIVFILVIFVEAAYIFRGSLGLSERWDVLLGRNKSGQSDLAKTEVEKDKANKTSKSNEVEAKLQDLENVKEKFSDKPGFANFNLEKTAYTAKIAPYQIKAEELANLTNLEKALSLNFSSSQKSALEKSNFFVTQNLDEFYNPDSKADSYRKEDWTNLYTQFGGSVDPSSRAPENAVFVSSDYLLHVYHRLLEKEFEYIEQKEFFPRLLGISQGMFNEAARIYKEVKLSPEDKASYERLTTYFAVPMVILQTAQQDLKSENFIDSKNDTLAATLTNLDKVKGQMSNKAHAEAKAEIELIMKAEKMEYSPLLAKYQKALDLDFMEDYTQYGPRSHYNKNAILRTYFRSMMWYGRQNLLLLSPELARDAANITGLVNLLQNASSNPERGMKKDWEAIYLPTAFFVGISDDLGLEEYGQVLNKNKNLNIGYVKSFGLTDEEIAKLQAELKNYRSPKIMSSVVVGDAVMTSSKDELQEKTKGFRFMGQRFTPDGFIFSTLTQGQEKPDQETGERLPSMTTALFAMTALGSRTAEPLALDWAAQNAQESQKVLIKKRAELAKYFAGLPEKDWTQNIYWGWLYTIKALLDKNSADLTGYPMFMRNTDWDQKTLQCSLGSWTELRHDTLLYAKQSYAEMGGGYDDVKNLPAVPKGYVEPNIEFFDRLIALVKMSRDGLNDRKLLPDEFLSRNNEFIKNLSFFKDIAFKELANAKISDEEFENLRTSPGLLSNVLRPLPGEQLTENDARSALIADVHTDVPGGKVLYEATGIPNYLYVAVKDQNGTRLTRGLTFSYYEFTGPIAKRLNDETWMEWNYSKDKGKVPAMAEWERKLIK